MQAACILNSISSTPHRLDVVAHACHLSTPEGKVGGPEVQGHPGPQGVQGQPVLQETQLKEEEEKQAEGQGKRRRGMRKEGSRGGRGRNSSDLSPHKAKHLAFSPTGTPENCLPGLAIFSFFTLSLPSALVSLTFKKLMPAQNCQCLALCHLTLL